MGLDVPSMIYFRLLLCFCLCLLFLSLFSYDSYFYDSTSMLLQFHIAVLCFFTNDILWVLLRIIFGGSVDVMDGGSRMGSKCKPVRSGRRIRRSQLREVGSRYLITEVETTWVHGVVASAV